MAKRSNEHWRTMYLIGAQKNRNGSEKRLIEQFHESALPPTTTPQDENLCNPDWSHILTHPPFACSWFWNPTLASIPPTPVCLIPLLMLFFFRFPFNQPNACPRELPDFFCPRWALASRAKISEMSLGTRSPVDLLRDILEDLGATPQPGWACPCVGKDADLGESVYSSCPSTPGTRRMSEGKDEVENENNKTHYTSWN